MLGFRTDATSKDALPCSISISFFRRNTIVFRGSTSLRNCEITNLEVFATDNSRSGMFMDEGFEHCHANSGRDTSDASSNMLENSVFPEQFEIQIVVDITRLELSLFGRSSRSRVLILAIEFIEPAGRRWMAKNRVVRSDVTLPSLGERERLK